MPPSRIAQWLNTNQYRRYPFVEGAVMTVPGSELPDDAILDLNATTYQDDYGALTLWRIQVTAQAPGPDIVAFTFRFGDETLATVEAPANAAHGYSATTGNASTHSLHVIFGTGVAAVAAWGAGTYLMDESPEIEPARVVFQHRHRVSSIAAAGTGQDSLVGDVYCEAGYNCVVTVTPGPPYPSVIRVRAHKGAGAGEPCIPLTDGVVSCAEALLRINGVPGSDDGQFSIGGGYGVEVVPDPDNNQVIIRRRSADTQELECEAADA